MPFHQEDLIAKEKQINEALGLIHEHGGTDGAHHKQWLLDQLVMILADNYAEWVFNYEHSGDYLEKTQKWDCGISP